jgi:BASS family bile acid:Na+ symporter
VFEAYPRYEHLLASAQLVCAMLGMGAVLRPRDFLGVVRAPRALAIGLATQLAAVPLLASLLGSALPVPAGIAAGLVLVAAVPGGTMSNVLTYVGRGNVALSITLTAVSTVGALATTPALLRLLIGEQLTADFEMPTASIAFEIGVTLLLPLFAGMLFGARFPEWRGGVSRWSIRASIAVILVMAVAAGGSGRLDPRAHGAVALVAVPLASLVFQQAGYAAAWLGRLPPRDRLAIAIEVTIRNANLAILVKASLFPASDRPDPIGDGMFFVALLYGGAALLVAALPVALGRRRLPALEPSA